MKPISASNSFVRIVQSMAIALAFAIITPTKGATIWSGPVTNFTQNSPSPSDQLTPGVVLSRGGRLPLFNTAAGESGPNGLTSPVGTEWAFGTLANATNGTLTYESLDSLRNNLAGGNFANVLLNQPMVLHLINEDIYLSVKFTAWGRNGAGGFAYERSTPILPPTVSITNPAPGASFTAPANFSIAATAAFGGGSVTNVAFFANGSPLGSDQTAPFSTSSGGLAAGLYGLTAVATAGGLSSTSTVVNITVLAPGAITLSSPRIVAGQFIFDYSTGAGLNYAIENSADLTSWQSLITNSASGTSEHYTNAFVPGSVRYYRVRQVP